MGPRKTFFSSLLKYTQYHYLSLRDDKCNTLSSFKTNDA